VYSHRRPSSIAKENLATIVRRLGGESEVHGGKRVGGQWEILQPSRRATGKKLIASDIEIRKIKSKKERGEVVQ